MHNIPNEVVLHAEDERFIKNLARRALGKTVRLSYFERQQAHDLGLSKALDSNGNIDLNLAANLMTQGPGTRISPNVRAANSDPLVKKSREDAVTEAAMCARHCQKNDRDVQGRTSCPRCHGQGYGAFAKAQADRATGSNSNIARHQLGESEGGVNGAIAIPNVGE